MNPRPGVLTTLANRNAGLDSPRDGPSRRSGAIFPSKDGPRV